MTVRCTDDAIHLEGRCRVEDAELLLTAIQTQPGLPVNLAGAVDMHTAVAQILWVLRPVICADATDPFMMRYVANDDG